MYLLHFFTDILGKINKVSVQLQKQEVDLGSVTNLISSLRGYLADMRSSNLIEHYCTKVNKLCEKCDIPSKLDGNGPENLVNNLTGLSHQKQPVRDHLQVQNRVASTTLAYSMKS